MVPLARDWCRGQVVTWGRCACLQWSVLVIVIGLCYECMLLVECLRIAHTRAVAAAFFL